MASRKRKPDSPQIGLAFAGPSLPPKDGLPPYTGDLVRAQAAVDSGSSPSMLDPLPAPSPKDRDTADHDAGEAGGPAPFDIEELDDYDDSETHEDVPRLRLVDPPRKVNVIVELVGDVYEVSRLRDGGTSVACVMWTRIELEELLLRVQAALEM